jgi:hypothetical protein
MCYSLHIFGKFRLEKYQKQKKSPKNKQIFRYLCVPAESKKLENISENPNFYDTLVTGTQLMDFFTSYWAMSIRKISKTKEKSQI